MSRGKIFLRVNANGDTKEYDNIMLASSDINCNFRNIWLCLQRKRNNCGGYGWVYKEDYDGNYNVFFTKRVFSKKIYSTLLNMEFKSAVEASDYTGISKSSICNYLKGKQVPKNGDVWIYI